MKLERALVEHGAPTLAGLKTGNLFPVKTGGMDIRTEIREANRMLTGKGLRLIPRQAFGEKHPCVSVPTGPSS